MPMMSQHLRDITDPEHPYSLEQLNVVDEEHITVDDGRGRIRCSSWSGKTICFFICQ